jgi:hypothetical protein
MTDLKQTDEFRNFTSTFREFMTLQIFVDSTDDELKAKYVESACNHNRKLIENSTYPDAGFDIYFPDNVRYVREDYTPLSVDYKIKCRAVICSVSANGGADYRFSGFYTYARSSISSTPLRLANNQGIIDAGYRGNLIAKFDCLSNATYQKFTRVMQICSPNLLPIYVEIVETIDDLGKVTTRGTGGFGSTGTV